MVPYNALRRVITHLLRVSMVEERQRVKGTYHAKQVAWQCLGLGLTPEYEQHRWDKMSVLWEHLDHFT